MGVDPVTERKTSFDLAQAERFVPLAALARVALILISPCPMGAERPSA
jgi:hypothetical protein